MTENAAGSHDNENDPPAQNQGQEEPLPTTPDSSSPSGSADAGSGQSSDAAGAGTLGAQTPGDVSSPGDAAGVQVPSVQSAAGSSEEAAPVDGVEKMANAAPGRPDGEVDTRA